MAFSNWPDSQAIKGQFYCVCDYVAAAEAAGFIIVLTIYRNKGYSGYGAITFEVVEA